MSSAMTEILNILPNAVSEGLITLEEKAKIKDLLTDEENTIVNDFVEEYAESKNKNTFFQQIRKYLKDIESDEESQNARDLVRGVSSPEGENLVRAKKLMQKESKKKVNDNLVSECEEGMSPKVVFSKK
jgi:hypothetical protein